MEGIGKYLPWIIGGIVLIYIFRKATSGTSFVPQTALTQTPQPDAYAQARSDAFQSLIGLGVAQTQADVAQTQAANQNALEKYRIQAEQTVQLAGINASQTIANLNFLQRSQDTQVQQGAIDRYYSSRNNASIYNSIAQAINGIFGGQGRNIFGTPPTFPTSSFGFGGF